MAWVKVWKDIKKQDQVTSKADDKTSIVSIEVIETWYAQADSAATNAIDAISAAAGGNTVPVAGNNYTLGGQTFYCNLAQPKRSSESPTIFEIQVGYIQRAGTTPSGSNPKWNIDIALRGQKFTQQAYQDKDGNAIVNTAGEPYDPSVTETHYDEILEISYNCLTPPDLSTFRGMVNNDAITFTIKGVTRSYTARQLCLDDGSVTTSVTTADLTTPIWKVSMTLLYKTDTFVDKILDRGYKQLQTIGGLSKAVPMKDPITKQPLNAPALLDASGVQLATGGTPHYSSFKIEKETAFATLFTGL